MAPHRPIERTRGLPLPARLLLVLAVVALGGTILYAMTGQLGKVVSGVGSALGGIVDQVTATASPTTAPAVAIDAPVLTPPAEAYTNQSTVDLTGSVPVPALGGAGYRIRVYVALKGQAPTPITDVAVGTTASFVVPGITLQKGVNDFTVTLVSPSGEESKPSAPIRLVLDTTPPKLTLTSPKDGDTVNAETVQLNGITQGRSQVIARDEANGQSVAATSAGDGSFTLTIPIAKGPNGITVTATDPAGNSASTVVGVTRGSGVLTATLRASVYRFSSTKLPRQLTLTAEVNDPDGHPLEGAAVTFTLSIPGVPVVTSDATTDATGTATFQTTVPLGATVGTGPATILVTTDKFGTTSARAVIGIVQ